MNNSEKYQYLSVEITLHINGYDYQDLQDLMQEPFLTQYTTKIGFQWHPAVAGEHFIEILLKFGTTIGDAIKAGYLKGIGSDLYNWTKTKLKKSH